MGIILGMPFLLVMLHGVNELSYQIALSFTIICLVPWRSITTADLVRGTRAHFHLSYETELMNCAMHRTAHLVPSNVMGLVHFDNRGLFNMHSYIYMRTLPFLTLQYSGKVFSCVIVCINARTRKYMFVS